MKNVKFLLAFMLIPSSLFALEPVGPINYGGGLNVGTIPTDIPDKDSADCSNMVSDRNGGINTRNGSKRFVSVPISTNPITSLYRAYASTGAGTNKFTFATTADKIAYSTSDVSPVWIMASSRQIVAPNQNYSFVTMNNKVIMTGDALTDSIKQVDLVTRSTASDLFAHDGTTISANIRAKYLLASKRYLIAANCMEVTNGTTYYANSLFYSLLNQPSSFTAIRRIDIKTTEGEQINGIGELFGNVNIFFDSSIYELSFSVLNVGSQGGDQTLAPVVNGFGCIAPYTLVSNGGYYVFLSKDGIRIWDGGRRGRLTVGDETEIISEKVKPIIDNLIQSGNYRHAKAVYNAKRNWYIFSYEDPNRFPRGSNNSMLIYDFTIKEWFQFKNILADGLASFEGAGDVGDILFGDSSDGYAHYLDLDRVSDDSRKEIPISNMDNLSRWTSATQDTFTTYEGTASMKLSIAGAGGQSSMTYLAVINAGEWIDRSKITKDDYLQFKVFATTPANISNLRIDLEVNDVDSAFDTNFTSVTVSSNSFSSSGWQTITVKLSSFPMRSDWTSFDSELVPFANTLTFYGLRFVLNGISNSAINIDDVRIVQATDNPLNPYWTTKLFNFGTHAVKGYRQILLTMEKSPASNILIDVYNDFGKLTRTEEISASLQKDIFVIGLEDSTGIAKMSSVDFAVKETSFTGLTSYNGTADNEYIYISDRINDQVVKIKKYPNMVIVSTYGAFGSGTTNFNLIHQSAQDETSIYFVDMTNQRIKAHNKNNFGFLKALGSLGNGSTNFHQPTGVAVDENHVFVADEGNYRITKFTKSTFGFVSEISIDYNTIGDTTLLTDEKYLYVAYDKISEQTLENLDVVLEKRNKSDLKLIDKTFLRPENVVVASTYSLMGDMAILGEYIFIPFTDNFNFDSSANYYIQKLKKDDFSIVKEYKSTKRMLSIIGDGFSYKPLLGLYQRPLKSEGKYIQLRYYADALDNRFKLYNQTFLVNQQDLKEE